MNAIDEIKMRGKLNNKMLKPAPIAGISGEKGYIL
jgi:hypothetical protein